MHNVDGVYFSLNVAMSVCMMTVPVSVGMLNVRVYNVDGAYFSLNVAMSVCIMLTVCVSV